jgi:DNA-binding CsgD family transcriptional regulator
MSLRARQQLLRENFDRARRHSRGALAVVSADTIMLNPAASRLVTVDDRARLWAWAAHHRARAARGAPVRMASGRLVNATAELICAGSQRVGAVVHLSAREQPTMAADRSAGAPSRSGWGSLTDAEWGVAEKVATGSTNREVAAALCLSPHTVDAHLRHIYTKLGITSRVHLVYLLVAETDPSTIPRLPLAHL